MNTLVAIAAVFAGAGAGGCPGLAVEDAWIRAAPPGAMMTAAYARLVNTGKAALVIDGASGRGFDSVELHHTVVEKGMSRMRQEPLRIAPGASALLAPGGWHLMLFGAAGSLAAGKTLPLTLNCGPGASEFPFTVKATE
jgi:hypothetical protein